ncbi:uncharacterized protein LOC126036799 isoform X2 [Accipiter gentilis]|uniref:uncharacterized protein LOC126036799 isoform X2 n=1 Tax=Astur gentilis TaxID=8957 RepID=UPI0021107E29|nr:uncharacterized protein LOC126036799 isoform X2 [Accipiter gentilis]
MAERPPGHVRQAWVEKAGAAPAPRSRPKPHEMSEVQLLRADLCCSALALPREEDNTLDIIRAFLRSRPKQEAQKLRFLASICTVCSTTSVDSAVWDVLYFCQPEVVETIEVLLQEEPAGPQGIMVQQQAMLAIISMRYLPQPPAWWPRWHRSQVGGIPSPEAENGAGGATGFSPQSRAGLLLQEKKNSLLYACFCNIFHLPPQEDTRGPDASLYSKTLATMDSMLQVLVRSAGTLGIVELQNILELLLPFTDSQLAEVQERAMARIARLVNFITTYSLPSAPALPKPRSAGISAPRHISL